MTASVTNTMTIIKAAVMGNSGVGDGAGDVVAGAGDVVAGVDDVGVDVGEVEDVEGVEVVEDAEVGVEDEGDGVSDIVGVVVEEASTVPLMSLCAIGCEFSSGAG